MTTVKKPVVEAPAETPDFLKVPMTVAKAFPKTDDELMEMLSVCPEMSEAIFKRVRNTNTNEYNNLYQGISSSKTVGLTATQVMELL